jgi:hypothetical protein
VRSWGTVYVLGPLIGGLLGVNLYYLFFAPAETRFALSALSGRRSTNAAATKTTTKSTRTTTKATKSTRAKAPARKTSSTRRTTRR